MEKDEEKHEPPRMLKILMLHGFQQSGHLFRSKTRALEKALQKAFPAAPAKGHLPSYPGGVSLIYPTAPIKLHASDLPGHSTQGEPTDAAAPRDEPDAYGWWIKNDKTGEYTHFERGIATIAEVLAAEGDVAGVIGFSQGGGAAAIVSSLLESGRQAAMVSIEGGVAYPESFAGLKHTPLKFGIVYSGMAADATPIYRGLYDPKIRTPLLHFIGSLDVVVEEARSLRLIDRCIPWDGAAESEAEREKRLVYHPGGHFLPTQKQYLGIIIGFIREMVDK